MDNRLYLAQQVNALFRLSVQKLDLTESEMMQVADLFPCYTSRPQSAWEKGEKFKWGVNAWDETQLWLVLEQIPPGNEHFTPDQLPRFFKAIGFADSGHPIWTRPLSAHDSYMKGDIVSHNGELWRSTANGNWQEPGTPFAPWERV